MVELDKRSLRVADKVKGYDLANLQFCDSGKLGHFNSECLASGTEFLNEILKGVVLFVFHQSCRVIAKHSSES